MKNKKQKIKNDVGNKRILFGVIVAVIVIFSLSILFFKYQAANPKNPKYTGNVTDIREISGEIVSYKYNNFQFEKREGMWITQIQRGSQPYIITFTYGPIYLENISITFKDNYFEQFTRPQSHVYVTFDHDTPDASYIATSAINLITNLNTVFGANVSRACLKNSTNCAAAPIVTCENRPNNAVIQFIYSNLTYVLYEENCVTIWGQKDDFIKATERVILNWYGIM